MREATDLLLLCGQIPGVTRGQVTIDPEVLLVWIYDEESVATEHAWQICGNTSRGVIGDKHKIKKLSSRKALKAHMFKACCC